MKGDLKSFLRGTLGCECRDEVFEKVEVLFNIELKWGLTLDAVITVGGKLLVYIARARDPETIGKDTSRLVKCGRMERDIRELHRFRLVFFTNDVASVRPAAEKAFATSPEKDEKMHLHVIDEKAVTELLGTLKAPR
jgi:hypothetical protein